jgi:hypothetical protein
MRPITRGQSPISEDFTNYRDAFGPLQARIGPYCSFCERRIVTSLAVEHIQPKDPDRYPELEGRWENFLLGCVNCNSTKGNQDLRLEAFYLPDRDNTLAAFTYLPDGSIQPSRIGDAVAAATLELVGLEKASRQVFDENGKLVAADRISQRMEAWLTARRSIDRLQQNPSEQLKESIVELATQQGFFSVWMTVFANVPEIRRKLLEAFPGTGMDCFNADTDLISPRPDIGLAGGGKI